MTSVLIKFLPALACTLALALSAGPAPVGEAIGGGAIDDVLRLFLKICDGVNAAHLKGVIHRDLKPANIRVDQQLDDDKAENILNIPLAGKSPMADAMVVASGRSARHVAALADHVARKLKEAGASKVHVEGLPNADWVLIDAGDVIVHIFRPEVRSFYNLEKLWSEHAPNERAMQ